MTDQLIMTIADRDYFLKCIKTLCTGSHSDATRTAQTLQGLLQSLPMVSAEPVAKKIKGETNAKLDFHSDNTSNGQQRELAGKMEMGQFMGDRTNKVESNSNSERAVAVIRAADEYGPLLDWFVHWVNYPVGTKLYISPQALTKISADDVTYKMMVDCNNNAESVLSPGDFAAAVNAYFR